MGVGFILTQIYGRVWVLQGLPRVAAASDGLDLGLGEGRGLDLGLLELVLELREVLAVSFLLLL